MLRSYLACVFPADILREIEPSLSELGRLAGNELNHLRSRTVNEPKLAQWDARGTASTSIDLTPLSNTKAINTITTCGPMQGDPGVRGPLWPTPLHP